MTPARVEPMLRTSETESGQRRERGTYEQLGEAVGISASQAHVILSRADIKPHRTESWVMTDFDQPEFQAREGEVCGLYLDLPENALVLSIDEKTSIQAKGLARPDTLPASGKPARRDDEYTRNGTMNLFAALRVHSGETHAMASQTRNRFDLIRFLEQIDETIPPAEGQQIIAIMDNLSTHKSADVQTWLDAHPRWRFVFTPTHASWLNQVEIFFSILAPATAQARPIHRPRGPRHPDARLRRASQPQRPTIRLDIHRQSPHRIRQTTNRRDH